VSARVDNEIRKQVARLLRRRPGWGLQAMSTPGAPVVWCFGTENEIELSVTVEAESICVHLVDLDRNVMLANADELVTWLKANRPTSLTDPKDSVVEKIKSRTLFKWS
jgi:hypothetical protein